MVAASYKHFMIWMYRLSIRHVCMYSRTTQDLLQENPPLVIFHRSCQRLSRSPHTLAKYRGWLYFTIFRIIRVKVCMWIRIFSNALSKPDLFHKLETLKFLGKMFVVSLEYNLYTWGVKWSGSTLTYICYDIFKYLFRIFQFHPS